MNASIENTKLSPRAIGFISYSAVRDPCQVSPNPDLSVLTSFFPKEGVGPQMVFPGSLV
jgi:hypothetical protein